MSLLDSMPSPISLHPPFSAAASLLYKGLALFTPGGDLVYCLDPTKQAQWHLHLCAALQNLLDLPEPPLFLSPCYTATLDRWLDPQTQQLHICAEAYPAVLRYQGLLNLIFATQNIRWQMIRYPEGICDPLVLQTYRQRFPQLWENHDLVMRIEGSAKLSELKNYASEPPETQGYVLRLFVAGHSVATEQALKHLHLLLNQILHCPYTLKVIDVAKQPEQAEVDQVTATPTLVKVWPTPVRRLVGDLDNVDKIFRLLSPVQ